MQHDENVAELLFSILLFKCGKLQLQIDGEEVYRCQQRLKIVCNLHHDDGLKN